MMNMLLTSLAILIEGGGRKVGDWDSGDQSREGDQEWRTHLGEDRFHGVDKVRVLNGAGSEPPGHENTFGWRK